MIVLVCVLLVYCDFGPCIIRLRHLTFNWIQGSILVLIPNLKLTPLNFDILKKLKKKSSFDQN